MLKKVFTIKNIKKHITWLNIILGLLVIIMSTSIRFILPFILTLDSGYMWLLSSAIALIAKLGIKGVVEDLMSEGLLEFLEQYIVLNKPFILKQDAANDSDHGGEPSDRRKQTPVVVTSYYDRVTNTIKTLFSNSNSSGLLFQWHPDNSDAVNLANFEQARFRNHCKLSRLNIYLKEIEAFSIYFSAVPASVNEMILSNYLNDISVDGDIKQKLEISIKQYLKNINIQNGVSIDTNLLDLLKRDINHYGIDSTTIGELRRILQSQVSYIQARISKIESVDKLNNTSVKSLSDDKKAQLKI